MSKKNNYQWQGLTLQGEPLHGSMQASNRLQVKQTLQQSGIITKKIKKTSSAWWSKIRRRIDTKDISLFSRQLATLLKAGLALIPALDSLLKATKNQAMQQLLQQLKTSLASGLSLAESLQLHPSQFNTLFCCLIAIGEKSASLELVLEDLAAYRDRLATIKNKIKKMLTYPIAVLIIAFIVSVLLLLFVVPQFELLFKSFGAELPTLTRRVIQLSQFLQKYWFMLLIILGTLLGSFNYSCQGRLACQEWKDHVLLQIPYFGNLVRQTIIARFARTLAITYAASLPLLEALNLAAQATGNTLYIRAIKDVQLAIINGQNLQVSLENTALFPTLVTQLLSVAEESSTLTPILLKIADYYEEEAMLAINNLNNLLEPIIISILGVVIGTLILAMYLPIVKFGAIM